MAPVDLPLRTGVAKRRRWVFATALAVASVAAVGGSGAYAAFERRLDRHLTAQGDHGLFAILGLRSPGGRLGGGLLQSKPGYVTKAGLRSPSTAGAAASGLPSERVLALVRERPPEAVEPSAPAGFIPSAPGSFALPSGPGAATPSPFGAGPFDAPFSQDVVPGSFGPSRQDQPPQDQPPIGPPVETGPAPAPEPGTWAMMILGVFAVGAFLRRERAAGRRLQQLRG